MATAKQRRAVNKLVETGGIVSKAMEAAGYSKKTAKTPDKLTKSVGFKELCEECGLTDELILQSLVDDIKGKPRNRKPELDLAAKIKGLSVDRIDITTKGRSLNDIKSLNNDELYNIIASESGVSEESISQP